jgi:hypothetical protein
MRIDLYTIAWNEMRLLPHFLDYYLPWVDRIVVFDDASDDGTRERLGATPGVELRDFPPKGDSFVDAALGLWNNAWKESRGTADWVVLTNIDEYIWHPLGMRAYLERCAARGFTVVHPRGYEMVAFDIPPRGTHFPDAARLGVPVFGFDKRQVFAPSAIEDMRYAPGRHWARPLGRAVDAAPIEAKLLHYKYIDYDGYHLPRQEALGARLLPRDIAKGWAAHYRVSREVRRARFDWLCLHATDVVSL